MRRPPNPRARQLLPFSDQPHAVTPRAPPRAAPPRPRAALPPQASTHDQTVSSVGISLEHDLNMDLAEWIGNLLQTPRRASSA